MTVTTASRLSGVPVLAACVAGGALLLAGCGSTTSGARTERTSTSTASPTVPVGANSAATQLQDDYQNVVREVLPSVVQITTGSDLGSGIVYDSSGHIVTNAHVVGDAKSFKVTLANSKTNAKATLVSSYPAQDLAVIKLDNPPGDLHAASFADSSHVAVGQITLAMGSPLGLNGSVTQGIVSALGRTVSEPASNGGTGATIANMVQTSAAINPGNSGGALVNLSGQVIGIPTLAATDQTSGGGAAAGIGFAIPAATVTRIADQIIQHGKVTDSGRAALGITGRTFLDADYEPAGVSVVSVSKNGGAAKAGLRAGDVITALGGTAITTIQSLTQSLASYQPGDRVKVTYQRGNSGRTHDVTVTLGTL
jgi:S1-C subfamily serine protease